MTERLTVYMPKDVLTAVRHAATDQDEFLSDFMTKAALAYLRSGGDAEPVPRDDTTVPAATKVRAATRTLIDRLRSAGPEGMKVHDLRYDRGGGTLTATDAAIAALAEAALLRRVGHRWVLVAANEPS